MQEGGRCCGLGDPCSKETCCVAHLIFELPLHLILHVLVAPPCSHRLSCFESWKAQCWRDLSSCYQKLTEPRLEMLSYTRRLPSDPFVRASHTHLPDLLLAWRPSLFKSVNPGKHFKHLPCFWLNAEQSYGWAAAQHLLGSEILGLLRQFSCSSMGCSFCRQPSASSFGSAGISTCASLTWCRC